MTDLNRIEMLKTHIVPLFYSGDYAEGRFSGTRWEYFRKEGLCVSDDLLASHVASTTSTGQRCGMYLLEPGGGDRTLVAVFDLDNKRGLIGNDDFAQVVFDIVAECRARRLAPIVFRSAGGKGVHVYLKWATGQVAAHVRALMESIAQECALETPAGAVRLTTSKGDKPLSDGNIEAFPKENTTAGLKAGHLVCLPFAGESCLVDTDPRKPIPDVQVAFALQHWEYSTDVAAPTGEPEQRAAEINHATNDDSLTSWHFPRSLVVSCLDHFHPDNADHQEWIVVGFAICATYGDSAFAFGLWREWSRSAHNYDEHDLRAKWLRDIVPHCKGTAGISTLMHRAFKEGWRPGDVDGTQVDLAELFEANYGEDYRYVKARKEWIVWREGRWVYDTPQATARTVQLAKSISRLGKSIKLSRDERHELRANPDLAAMNAIADLWMKWGKAMQTLTNLTASLELTWRNFPSMYIDDAGSRLDSNPMLLQVANGTLDLTEQKLVGARRENLITKRARVNYDPEAKCPRWSHFITEVSNDDSDLVAWKQMFWGYCLTGLTDTQMLAFYFGDGANGKSVETRIMQTLMGDYAAKIPSDSLMRKPAGTPTNDIARLAGVRLAIGSEIGLDKEFNEQLIKDMTGSDTMIGRFLYKEYIEFLPSHKIVLYGNNQPRIKESTYAIWRRLKAVPFLRTFKFDATNEAQRADTGLFNELLSELPGILNWMLEGLGKFLAAGKVIADCAAIVHTTDRYRANEDSYVRWREAEVIADDNATPSLSLQYLHDQYKKWCSTNGYGSVSSDTALSKRLEAAGFAKTRSGGRTKFAGLRLVVDQQLLANNVTGPEPDPNW